MFILSTSSQSIESLITEARERLDGHTKSLKRLDILLTRANGKIEKIVSSMKGNYIAVICSKDNMFFGEFLHGSLDYFRDLTLTYKNDAEFIERLASQSAEEEDSFEKDHTIVAGDFMYMSWGHEQTNIDFLEVIKVSKKTVTVRKVGQTYDYDTMTTSPIAGSFESEPTRLTANGRNEIRYEDQLAHLCGASKACRFSDQG